MFLPSAQVSYPGRSSHVRLFFFENLDVEELGGEEGTGSRVECGEKTIISVAGSLAAPAEKMQVLWQESVFELFLLLV